MRDGVSFVSSFIIEHGARRHTPLAFDETRSHGVAMEPRTSWGLMGNSGKAASRIHADKSGGKGDWMAFTTRRFHPPSLTG